MHINEDHMYHGAALTQIADRPEFKAINAFKKIPARGAFRINGDTGIYIKHALAPTKSRHAEYVFTFNQKALSDIEAITGQCEKAFIVLVCVKDKEICVITAAEFDLHIQNRTTANKGQKQTQYQILVQAHPGKKFRVYVNAPKGRGQMIGEKLTSRNAFPEILF